MSTGPATNAAPIIATCPRCSTQLKLLRPPIEYTPIKCYRCQSLFCLEAIETAPVEAPSGSSLPPISVSSMPLPGSRDAAAAADMRPLTLPSVAPAVLPTMTPPAPLSAPPPPAPARLPTMTPAPAPIVAAPPAASKPAAAPPVVPTAAKKPRMILDLSPTESLVAVIVTVLVAVGLILGGIYAVRTFIRVSQDPSDTMAIAAPKTGPNAEKPPLITHAGPGTMPLLPDLPANAAAMKSQLLGSWVSRADDGSVATFEFRPDGTATFRDVLNTQQGAEPLTGRWAVIGANGNLATVAIYYSVSGLVMHRMTIELATPECINVIESAFNGAVQKWDQRFVREPAPPS